MDVDELRAATEDVSAEVIGGVLKALLELPLSLPHLTHDGVLVQKLFERSTECLVDFTP
ncbi:MAG: hypothetical protein KY469_15890 [Actinobacteria bacterium]|nr:hypothetical protein [Actinomycetota bacterium]